ncbi:MAG: hypothetical protein BMS9Abin20_0516 [Acidimicrobiia bacterium]|nr:MAG: hypothetical protein BMS9Abin20_0516 [Acidimicrobiia bacterium]
MKTVKILVAGWVLLIVLVAAIIVTNATAASDPKQPTGHQVVTDLGQLDMLASNQGMLQQMRSAATPNMLTMIETNPMWTDPDMIRRQEEYQHELDRMIGKRPSQP